MDVIPDARMWAEHNFAAADLGDRRRTRRLIESAANIAAHPEKSFPQVFDCNVLRGFYRLCDQTQATAEAVVRPHGEQTRQVLATRAAVGAWMARATAEATALYRRRSQTVEWANADGKQQRKLRRFSGRGRPQVGCPVGLVVLAPNLVTLLSEEKKAKAANVNPPEVAT